jgi:hypothetical protein
MKLKPVGGKTPPSISIPMSLARVCHRSVADNSSYDNLLEVAPDGGVSPSQGHVSRTGDEQI